MKNRFVQKVVVFFSVKIETQTGNGKNDGFLKPFETWILDNK